MGPSNDRSTVQLVVALLGTASIVGIVGIIALAATSHPVPDILGNVTVAAGTALGTLLASTRSVDPQQVQQEGYAAAVADVNELAAGGELDPAPPAAG